MKSAGNALSSLAYGCYHSERCPLFGLLWATNEKVKGGSRSGFGNAWVASTKAERNAKEEIESGEASLE